MTDHPSIDRIAALQQLIADLAKVERRVKLADNHTFENDVEHSYGLALTCWYLQPKIAPHLNLERIFKYALSHDIVELHAGDTYFLDEAAVATKDANERSAVNSLKNDWSDFADISTYAEQYMDKFDEEAKFVKAVDKMLPVLMIGLGEGMQTHYTRNKLTLELLKVNKKSIHVSDLLSPYYDALFDWLERTENTRNS